MSMAPASPDNNHALQHQRRWEAPGGGSEGTPAVSGYSAPPQEKAATTRILSTEDMASPTALAKGTAGARYADTLRRSKRRDVQRPSASTRLLQTHATAQQRPPLLRLDVDDQTAPDGGAGLSPAATRGVASSVPSARAAASSSHGKAQQRPHPGRHPTVTARHSVACPFLSSPHGQHTAPRQKHGKASFQKLETAAMY